MEGYLKSDESSFKEVDFFFGGGGRDCVKYILYIYIHTM